MGAGLTSRPHRSARGGSARPFRFAVVAAGLHDAGSWRRLCLEVESLGYSALHLPDSGTPQMAPLTALAAAAAHTSTLRVGMLVANNDLRHPAVLARELATLDVLSGGRVEWGMGAGWLATDVESLGLAFDRPAVRVDRLCEAVELMQELFGGEVVTHEGEHYAVTDLRLVPQPLQPPHPPLLVGAAGRRLLTFAGRRADVVSVNRSFSAVSFGGRPPRRRPDDAVAEQIGWVREGAGDRFGAVELSLEVNPPVVVTDRRRDALAQLAAATGQAPELVAADPRTWVGSTAAIVDGLEGHRERFGVSHWVVYEPYLRDAAPIVAELAGR